MVRVEFVEFALVKEILGNGTADGTKACQWSVPWFSGPAGNAGNKAVGSRQTHGFSLEFMGHLLEREFVMVVKHVLTVVGAAVVPLVVEGLEILRGNAHECPEATPSTMRGPKKRVIRRCERRRKLSEFSCVTHKAETGREK